MRSYKVPESCIFRAAKASEYICLFCSFFYGFDKKRTFFLTGGSEKHIFKDSFVADKSLENDENVQFPGGDYAGSQN